MRRRGAPGARLGQRARRLPMASICTVMPAPSIQFRNSAWTACIEGVRKRRVISPGTSVQAAISRQRAMTRAALSLYVPVIGAFLTSSGLAPNARFDISVRFVCGNENLIWIVLPEPRKIDQKAVLVRHRDLDFVDFSYFFKRALGHCVECLLDRFAVVVGEGAKHRLAKLCAYTVKGELRREVAPRRTDSGAEEPILRLRKCRERILDKAFEARVCRFEENEVI